MIMKKFEDYNEEVWLGSVNTTFIIPNILAMLNDLVDEIEKRDSNGIPLKLLINNLIK